jgi:hypothetical protein
MRVAIPTIRDLMDDPAFRSYMKRNPPQHHANATGEPWQLWLRTPEGRWKTKTYAEYREVWPVFVRAFRDPEMAADVTITSRRIMYAPPGENYRVKVRKKRRPTPDDKSTTQVVAETRWRQTFFWDIGLEWCGRCRRPVHWQPLHAGHHAIKRQPAMTPDENLRCIICGIRWCAMPDIDQMERF